MAPRGFSEGGGVPFSARPAVRDRVAKVAVVGAGTIGAGWATFFVAQGLSVNLFDVSADAAAAARERVAAGLDFLARHGLLTGAPTEAARRLELCDDLAQTTVGVDLVQEAVRESYEAKEAVFGALDALLPADVLLASSSSGLLMSQIQRAAKRYPERCLIAHPINPVYLVPLVELVPGAQTLPAVLTAARRFYEGLGKAAVTLTREIPGYLENRMTAALWREAIDLVHQGIATVEDVDRAIWAGPGLRYALMGPLMIYHLGGGPGGVRHFVEHLGPAFRTWWADMRTWTEPPEGALERLEAGLRDAMGSRTIADLEAWRDERLVALLRARGETKGLL